VLTISPGTEEATLIDWMGSYLMADFMNFPTPRERVLTCGNTTVGVIPGICLVSHFQVDSWQVLYRPAQTGNVKRWGLPLMIPNFSRLKDGVFKEKGTTLPIHGFGRNMPWTVIEVDETHLAMQLTSNEITLLDYPYEFMFNANIEVSESTLKYTLTMENRSNENMPIAPGFHPYIAVAQSEKANVVTDGPPGFDVHAFDWVQYIPDNPYPFPHRVTIRFPAGGTLTIAEIAQTGKYALSNIQVWSEPPTKADHDFICFEPTVGSEDALNRAADRLNIEPGGSKQIVLQLYAKPL
jgi:galactose mutarotase-like enzyme